MSKQNSPKLLDQVRDVLRLKHYSIHTERTYCDWIRRFVHFHGMKSRKDLSKGEAKIEAFLTHLAVEGNVSPATQNQAMNALVFLYKHVLKKPLKEEINAIRAQKKPKIPVIMTQDEVSAVISFMKGVPQIVCMLLYGSGLRIAEAIRLRVLDVDFKMKSITVRSGKGGKDRVTPLPLSAIPFIQTQLERARTIHEQDIANGYGEVYMPYALSKKYPNKGKEWGWQYIFPSSKLSTDPRSKKIRRHHIDPSIVNKAIKSAVKKAGIDKHVTAHTFRHSFATHLLQQGKDIRTIQALLGHKDVATTMIYTHVLEQGAYAVESPLDALIKPHEPN